MYTFEVKTLIDITNTQVVRPNQGSQLEYDQNRNFITLRQCVELRSIVGYDSPPWVEKIDLETLEFGSRYKGKHRVWTFRFTPDRDEVYSDSQGNVASLLLDDLNGVPIIKNLTETINIEVAVFECNDAVTCNTIIKAHPGTI